MKLKKITSLTLAGISALSLVGCSNGDGDNTLKVGNIDIWSAPAYVKVFQDKDYSDDEAYSSFYALDGLEVFTYKNEQEAGQIILTPDYDVKEYDISLAKLVSSDGTEFPLSAMTVYNQKYVEVSAPSRTQTNSTMGMTPDALLPFETAKEFGENVVSKDKNQGIVVEFSTPENQTAGIYTGTFTLSADGKDYSVPVSLTVWDAVVSSENNLKTSFLVKQDKVFSAEMDASYEMYEKYYEKLLDYRICATNMPLHNVKDFNEYLSQLKKYTKDARASTIQFFDVSNSSWTDYDYDVFEDKIVEIAEESFTDGVNYLKKLVYYLGMIDEPHITNTQHRVDPMLRCFAKARNAAMRTLNKNRAEYNVSDELFSAVIERIENFPFVVTATHADLYDYEWNEQQKRLDAEANGETYVSNPDEEYKITFCPVFDGMNTETQRENNRLDGLEGWWYGCDYPTDPYPNYHLDETLIPARVLSWMQYNYGITGNLYWAVNNMSDQNEYKVTEVPENVYDDLANENVATKGEGFLVYPGKLYGLDNFVPSLRLTAIRDGMEEYEILRATGEVCDKIATQAGYENYEINNTFTKLYESLYQGSKITGDHNDFTVSRQLLATFAVFANKGVLIADVKNKSYSTEVKVFVQDGSIQVNGVEPEFIQRAGGKEYTVEVAQTKTENYLTFSFIKDGKTDVFNMFVGGKKAALKLDKITFGSNAVVNDVTTLINSDGSVTVTVGALKKDDLDDKRQRIYFSGDEIENNLKKSKNVSAIVIEIENLGQAFDLSVRYTGTRDTATILDFLTQEIPANATSVVTIETGALKWDFGAINELRFYMDYKDVFTEHSVTIKAITLTY